MSYIIYIYKYTYTYYTNMIYLFLCKHTDSLISFHALRFGSMTTPFPDQGKTSKMPPKVITVHFCHLASVYLPCLENSIKSSAIEFRCFAVTLYMADLLCGGFMTLRHFEKAT